MKKIIYLNESDLYQISKRVIEDQEGNTIYCNECYKKRKELDDNLKEFLANNHINLAKFYKQVEKECRS
jgi:deoxyribodipyrimidine photolyase